MISGTGGGGPGGNLNALSIVPCLIRGGPRFFFVGELESSSSDPPCSSGVGSKPWGVARAEDSILIPDARIEGEGSVGVRAGAGIEARLAALFEDALWGSEACDID